MLLPHPYPLGMGQMVPHLPYLQSAALQRQPKASKQRSIFYQAVFFTKPSPVQQCPSVKVFKYDYGRLLTVTTTTSIVESGENHVGKARLTELERPSRPGRGTLEPLKPPPGEA